MCIIATIAGAAMILMVFWEGFETIILPRRVTRRVRLTRLFYHYTWTPYVTLSRFIRTTRDRETYLSIYGPLSLLALLSIWALGLITGFGLLIYGIGSATDKAHQSINFATNLYLSATTFFTLGLGDVTPNPGVGRAITAVEAGMGFGFLALVIGYLPALNQSFSRREVSISLLDSRAGSPPTACEILRRHSHDHGMEELRQLLHEWERWSAEFLEGHLSYPVLAYFRSQHENQSWLASLTAILDTSALIIVGVEGACERQAELTFAMARHAVVDLSQVFNSPPRPPSPDRLHEKGVADLSQALVARGLKLKHDPEAELSLLRLRNMYEPYVFSLATYFRTPLPPWVPPPGRSDNWQTSGWEERKPRLPAKEKTKRQH